MTQESDGNSLIVRKTSSKTVWYMIWKILLLKKKLLT